MNDDRNLRQRAFYYTRVYADPKVKDTVYVLNVNFYKSTDAGKTWTNDARAARRQPRPVDRARRFEPDDRSQRRRRATSRSTAARPGPTRTMPTAQFYHVFTTEARAVSRLRRAAGQLHRVRVEPAARAARRSGGGADQVFYSVGGGESGYIAQRSAQPGHLLRRQLRRPDHAVRSRAPASSATINLYPDNPMGYASDGHRGALPVDVPDRLLADRPEDALYVVAARLEDDQRRTELDEDQPGPDAPRSEDDGRRRAGRSPRTTPASRPTRRSSRSRRRRRTSTLIWTGSDDGFVHVTRDGGTNWENVTPKDLPRLRAHQPDRGVAASAPAPPTSPPTATSMDDLKPYVYKTDDYGKTLDEDRQRRRATRLRARRSARTPSARGCCISAPSTASTCRSTTARTGSRCS